MPSSLLFCLGGHQVFKSMHPTKFLGCNSWTLPFPITAGGQRPTGLQTASSRAGPAGQSKGRGVPAGEITRQDKSLGLPGDLAAGTRLLGKTAQVCAFCEGVKSLTPMTRPFCDGQVSGLGDCANREGGIRGSLCHPAPPSPGSLTCGPHPSAPLTECRLMGTQEPTKWTFPAATETP